MSMVFVPVPPCPAASALVLVEPALCGVTGRVPVLNRPPGTWVALSMPRPSGGSGWVPMR